MKKVYDKRILISFNNGKTFEDTSFWNNYIYIEEKFAKNWQSNLINNFQVCQTLVEQNCIKNTKIKYTLFTKKPILYFSTNDSSHYFTEKRYKPIIIRKVYEEVKDASLKRLADELTAKDFIEYVKDKM